MWFLKKKGLEEKLELFEELKKDYYIKRKMSSPKQLNGYEAIGLREYYSQQTPRTNIHKLIQKITGTTTETITEKITFFVKSKEQPEEENIQYQEIIIATHKFKRTTTQDIITRITTTYPKTKIKDTQHEVEIYAQETIKNKINPQKLKETEFLYCLKTENLKKIKELTKQL